MLIWVRQSQFPPTFAAKACSKSTPKAVGGAGPERMEGAPRAHFAFEFPRNEALKLSRYVITSTFQKDDQSADVLANIKIHPRGHAVDDILGFKITIV